MSPTDSAVGRFLTVADTAEVLNISVESTCDLIRSGELPAIRVGRHGPWRIERTVLEDYIAALYEEARRMSLWQRTDHSGFPDLSGEFDSEPGAEASGGAIISPIHRRISSS